MHELLLDTSLHNKPAKGQIAAIRSSACHGSHLTPTGPSLLWELSITMLMFMQTGHAAASARPGPSHEASQDIEHSNCNCCHDWFLCDPSTSQRIYWPFLLRCFPSLLLLRRTLLPCADLSMSSAASLQLTGFVLIYLVGISRTSTFVLQHFPRAAACS